MEPPEWRAGLARYWLKYYNKVIGVDFAERSLQENLGAVGKNCCIRIPFNCEIGKRIFLGDDVFVNMGCTFLDVDRITIGDRTIFGPNVQLITGTHGENREIISAPITIGKDAWIGAGAIILPGITIGDNAIVGAGSVVTRDVPANIKVMGNPASVRG